MTPAHDNALQPNNKLHGKWWLSLIVVPLSACVAVTQSNVDISKLANRWHATLPHSGSTAQLVDWWNTFNDPALSELLRTAEANSPTLESAVAEIEEARATLASSKADYFPSLTGSGSDDRSGTRGSKANRVAPSSTGTGELDASWELDFSARRATPSMPPASASPRKRRTGMMRASRLPLKLPMTTCNTGHVGSCRAFMQPSWFLNNRRSRQPKFPQHPD